MAETLSGCSSHTTSSTEHSSYRRELRPSGRPLAAGFCATASVICRSPAISPTVRQDPYPPLASRLRLSAVRRRDGRLRRGPARPHGLDGASAFSSSRDAQPFSHRGSSRRTLSYLSARASSKAPNRPSSDRTLSSQAFGSFGSPQRPHSARSQVGRGDGQMRNWDRRYTCGSIPRASKAQVR